VSFVTPKSGAANKHCSFLQRIPFSTHSPNIVSAFLINLHSSQVNLIDMFFRTKLLHIAACIATAQALQISTPVSPIIKSLTTR